MKTKTYSFYNDPGHGWLAVKRKELVELGIIDKITEYSYQRGQTVYLEEDCDATLFVNAYTAKHGVKPVTKDIYHEHMPIRGYDSFKNLAEV
jgi:hypothetical protein